MRELSISINFGALEYWRVTGYELRVMHCKVYFNPQPAARNPKPETRNPEYEIL